MNFLLVDPVGAMLPTALRLQRAGHRVRWFIAPRAPGKPSQIGMGFEGLTRVREWEAWTGWADVVILADNVSHLRGAAAARKRGVPVVGPSAEGASLELDRAAGQRIFADAGIDTLPSFEFDSYEAAVAFVRSRGGRWVSKPNDEADKSLSYVAKTPADLIFMLERWKVLGKLKKSFILQRFAEGVEMAVGGWLTPMGFEGGWCENFEHKKLMNGDKGPTTGEMGTVLRYTPDSKLADRVLRPLTERLLDLGITGYVDVNCIVTADGEAWPLEWTVRPGYPTLSIQEFLHVGDPGEWWGRLATGDGLALRTSTDVAVGVVLAIPDFPYSHATQKEVTGLPVWGYADVADHVALYECQWGEALGMRGPKVVQEETALTAGDYVLGAVGTAPALADARASAYETLNKLSLPNSPFWRTDIGDRLQTQLPILWQHGFALTWKEVPHGDELSRGPG